MIINRLTLTNYGVYRGVHEFDLRPAGSRPIIIVGGKNGAGKSTLLDAIRLCLYGQAASDDRAGRIARPGAYEEHLRERIHRVPKALPPVSCASVEVEFEHAVAGRRQTYAVKRSWEVNSRRLKDVLSVHQDGQLLEQITTGQWSCFLHELIPPGLAQIFFFDTEKIEALAEPLTQTDNGDLSRTIKTLLGLDIVGQLQADLHVCRRRRQRDNVTSAVEMRIETLEGALAQVNVEADELSVRLGIILADITAIEARMRAQEEEIARLGGGFARLREVHKETLIRVRTDTERTEEAIRDLCSGLLPFAIAPAYTEAVRSQLLREAAYQEWSASRQFVVGKMDTIQARIESPEFWHGIEVEVSDDLPKTIAKRVVCALQRVLDSPESVGDAELRHHASVPERQRLLQWIEESRTTVPEQLRQLTTQLKRLREQQQGSELALQRVPDDDVLGPLVDTLNSYNRELGALTHQQHQVEEALRLLGLQREELRHDLLKTQDEIAAHQSLVEKDRRISDVQLALDDFSQRLIELRVSQLGESLTRSFNRLCRKEHLVQQAHINPDDFSVDLVGVDGDPLPHKNLSAGERQIYGVALLWALHQVSGRPIPVIIDAPLGRLDDDHRQNLVQRYFPHASHQVILLSTDTEVDARFYAAMEPAVSHAYHLEYDQAQRATEVKRGYFWEQAEVGEK